MMGLELGKFIKVVYSSLSLKLTWTSNLHVVGVWAYVRVCMCARCHATYLWIINISTALL